MKHIDSLRLIDAATQGSAGVVLGLSCIAPSTLAAVAASVSVAVVYGHRAVADMHMLRTMADLNAHPASTADEIRDRLGLSTHFAVSALSRLLDRGLVTRASHDGTDLFRLT
ncbi:MarR family transcriptional regulator [Streptomyces sp. CL12]|uniref:MarR family transcriptional regulator n=1 Tax=Streptomyces sp. CL12 TaxID=3391744 RepID=UPI003A8034BB